MAGRNIDKRALSAERARFHIRDPPMSDSPVIRWTLYAMLAAVTVAAVWYKLVRPEEFSTVFAREDGVVEYGTAILLAAAGVVLAVLAARNAGYRKALLVVYAAAFVFAAGEEISWGQRIFGIESPEFFLENNRQQETNLHNLVVGEDQLAKFWFGHLLTLVLLLYLVVLPILYPLAGWVRWLADVFAVPVPPRHVGAIAVAWSLLVVWIDLPRNWEVYEFVFAALVCLIFTRPVNRQTFGL
jgi:hypothetical protein